MPILKSLFSNEGAFFVHQNVAIQSPPLEGDEGGGCFYVTSLTKACSDYASEWTRDPGRSGFILINSYFFTFF